MTDTAFSERYMAYIHSDDWLAKKAEYWASGRYCRGCGATENLEVDHLDYARLGDERMTDLLGLCDVCHDVVTRARKAAGATSGSGYRRVTEQVLGVTLPRWRMNNRDRKRQQKIAESRLTAAQKREMRALRRAAKVGDPLPSGHQPFPVTVTRVSKERNPG